MGLNFQNSQGVGGLNNPWPWLHMLTWCAGSTVLCEDATVNHCFYLFSNPLGVAGGGSPHILVLVLLYSGDPTGTFDTIFSLGVIHLNKCHFWGKPPPKIAATATHFLDLGGVLSVHGINRFGIAYGCIKYKHVKKMS